MTKSQEHAQKITSLESELTKKESLVVSLTKKNEQLHSKLTAMEQQLKQWEDVLEKYPFPIFTNDSKESGNKLTAVNKAATKLKIKTVENMIYDKTNKFMEINHKKKTIRTKTISSNNKNNTSLHIFQDISDLITEKAQKEEELNQKDKKIKNLIERNPNIIIQINQTGNITKINTNGIQNLSLSIGSSIYEIIEEKTIQSLKKNNEKQIMIKINEKQYKISTIYSTINKILFCFEDITQMNEIINKTQECEKLKQLIENLQIHCLQFDSNGNLIQANQLACTYFQQTKENLKNKNVNYFFENLSKNWKNLPQNTELKPCFDHSKTVSIKIQNISNEYFIFFEDISENKEILDKNTKTIIKYEKMNLIQKSFDKFQNFLSSCICKNLDIISLLYQSIHSDIQDFLFKALKLNEKDQSVAKNYSEFTYQLHSLFIANQTIQKLSQLVHEFSISFTDKNLKFKFISLQSFMDDTFELLRNTSLQQMEELEIKQNQTKSSSTVDYKIKTIPSYLRLLIQIIILLVYENEPINVIELKARQQPTKKSNKKQSQSSHNNHAIIKLQFSITNGNFTKLIKTNEILKKHKKNAQTNIFINDEDIDDFRLLKKEDIYLVLLKYLCGIMNCFIEIKDNNSSSNHNENGCNFIISIPDKKNNQVQGNSICKKKAMKEDHNNNDSSSSNVKSLEVSYQNQKVVRRSSCTTEEIEEEKKSTIDQDQTLRRLSSGLSLTLGQESQERKYHCLVVDDNKLNLLLIKKILQSVGITVTLANNGFEAQKLILEKDEKFDIILLDIIMPGINGYEVCKNIRKKYLPIELPIILLTAKGQLENILDGFECGANDYLTKPFQKLELVARLFSHIRLARVNYAYGRFIPRQFLQLLGKNIITDVSIGDNAQLNMPIMFTDIRSFTSISEQLSPKQVFDFLNNLLKSFGPIIRDHDGFIDKFIGDAIMALFPNSAFGALKSAIQIIKCLNSMNFSEFTNCLNASSQVIRVGVGIHSGPVIMGTVGDSLRMDTTVISDTVNIASRIEGLTKAFGVDILVTENFMNDLSDDEKNSISYRCVGKLVVKGKKIPIVLYEIFDADCDDLKNLKLNSKIQFDNALQKVMSGCYCDAGKLFSNLDPIDPVVLYYNYFCTTMASKEGVTEVVLEKDGLVSQVGDAPVSVLNVSAG